MQKAGGVGGGKSGDVLTNKIIFFFVMQILMQAYTDTGLHKC